MTELEFRDMQIAEVSFPKGEIELIVMPYETVTTVEHHGRMIEEIVSRGAFDGIDKPAVTRRIKVNLDHKPDFASRVGDTIALHPSRVEGLVAEVKIRRKHPLAEQVLDSADDGELGASAGFGLLFDQHGKTYPDAETWETRARRRLKRLWLDHIALTPRPAYPGAKVLAIRNDETAALAGTPNLDLVRSWQLAERYARLEAKL